MQRLLTRGWILPTALLLAYTFPYEAIAQTTSGAGTEANGQLTESSLGNMLLAMGLKPKKEKQRYDFRFKAILDGNEWELSMSAVLSVNKKSVWVMAWLDELPKSAGDVPRTALLRLLADNDRLGKGKFFAYVASNRRFVLQRIIPNENLSTAAFRDVLKDLGTTVVVTYPHWSVSNWNSNGAKSTADNGASPKQAPVRSTVRDPKFGAVRRN